MVQFRLANKIPDVKRSCNIEISSQTKKKKNNNDFLKYIISEGTNLDLNVYLKIMLKSL